MSEYIHEPAPSDKARSFVKWCAENINEWNDEYISVARFIGSNNKWWKRNFEWRKRHDSLSYSWAVCTKRQWNEARSLLPCK